jgi:hypothetical protein
MSRAELRVGLAQINTGLSWMRQRSQGRRAAGGGVRSARGDRDAEPDRWSVFPYSTGLLQAYAQRHAGAPQRYVFLPPVYERMAVDEAATRLESADVVGFSAYVWNIGLSLAIARRIRERRPGVLIVFGGPQVPDRAEAFLRENPFVDVACHGEGEAVFLALLETHPDRAWPGVPGISFLAPDGSFVTRERPPRIGDLSRVPSPYLSGVFDGLLSARPQERWILLWETNRGCPFSCTFCDWGSAVASKVYSFDMERLRQELEWFAERKGEFVFCGDANFGILPRDVEIALMAAEVKRRRGYPRTLSVQNTKNATERAYRVQRILADAGMNAGVTLSLQSLDPVALATTRRDNISLASFQELQRRYTRDRIDTYTDMILALPGETYGSFADGVASVIENGQHCRIQFYNCAVLPNAEMADPLSRQRQGITTVRQRIIPMHASIPDEAEEPVPEHLDVVVATAAMPAGDWVRAKAFSWATDLFHFDRLLQVPFVVLHALYGVSYRDLVEAAAGADPGRFPILAEVQAFFLGKAREIQRAGPEYCASEEWLGLWWPADQLALITLASEWKTEAFYREAEAVLAELLAGRGVGFDAQALHDAVVLNESLLRLPFEIEDLTLELDSNVWEVYCAAKEGDRVPLERTPRRYLVDRTSARWLSWQDWCAHVVACQNQKSAYLHALRPSAPAEMRPRPVIPAAPAAHP